MKSDTLASEYSPSSSNWDTEGSAPLSEAYKAIRSSNRDTHVREQWKEHQTEQIYPDSVTDCYVGSRQPVHQFPHQSNSVFVLGEQYRI